MLPTIAIVGRPNVGKSTLFNALTKRRDALVADQPGLTRDRQFGRGVVGDRPYLLIDTGGLDTAADEAFHQIINKQVFQAIDESDCVLFVVDGRDGLSGEDEEIAQRLRQINRPLHLVVNKTEGLSKAEAMSEFYRLGFEFIHAVSAVHREGLQSLIATVLTALPEQDEAESEAEAEGIRIAVAGRPNVGKSTLVNRILGYERVIAFDQPGTTRDSITIPFERQGTPYVLIDTAGVRRRARVDNKIEKFSIIKTFQAIEASDVTVLLLDASEGVTDQDASLLGQILDSGRALVIAANKWDGLDSYQRDQVRHKLSHKLHFLDFADIHFISALHGSGVGLLFDSINIAWQAADQRISTPRLNAVLTAAVEQHPPPAILGRRIKLRYIHQGGQHPPLFVIHGNQVDSLPGSYKRYLSNVLRQQFNLRGTPIQLVFKQGTNPFEGRQNTLTERQIRRRKRLISHVKRK